MLEMMLCFAVICDLIGKTEQLVKKNSIYIALLPFTSSEDAAIQI